MTITRRGIISGAGLAASLAAEQQPPPRSKRAPSFWTAEYWARKGEVSLYMWRKRLAAPKAGQKPRPVLFLVHGSSISARSSYDLTVPGRGEYSVMNVFARAGFDVWTMDHENYGRSSRTAGNSDIASGVEDLKSGLELVARETGQENFNLYGDSSGGIRAGAYAMARPDRVRSLALAAFTYKGENSPTLTERAKQLDYYRTHNRRKRDLEMIRSIYTRDKTGTADPAVGEAQAAAELKFGDEAPTGTYLDMTANLPLVDPTKVLCPVLMLRGEYDGIATMKDLSEFFNALPNGNRQFVVLPGTAHAVSTGLNRHLAWHVMLNFLNMPDVVKAPPA